MSGAASRQWSLFRDWCTAAGLDPLPTTAEAIAQFLREVPAAPATQAKRVQTIRRIHREAGAVLALPEPVAGRPWREGEGWLDLAGTLACCPVDGWTQGLAGRRDAFLAVLAGACGFTREQARAVVPADIRPDRDTGWMIRDVPLERTADPVGCPACAAARWLEVLGRLDGRGRASAQSCLTGYRPGGHDCLEPPAPAALEVPTLLPAIDRYGWLADWAPLTARSISAILAYRQDASRQPAVDHGPPEREGERREDYQRASMQELAEILDVLERKADEALRASDAVIADTHSMLGRIRGR
ncbi:hypothetical protein LVY72_21420 [Arthrobacter sp. I2-34]|uniref:Uncharacterized protein n=1 Tax=Arthrobacter hankyongi TaxID=2904801 RepID=A0ABS9LCP8_9MICC|nr:hypothetical protein [Arthrobacter hankyongi]MCG2624452.1 hypothetical protein [Arthrobacter hankyongi]